ncbi:MAG: PD40 domain-containing protein [Gemmatimonadota bacterium]|nr:MAG: PD40 domain-containing protein [Gemmatimonadota bacterium]
MDTRLFTSPWSFAVIAAFLSLLWGAPVTAQQTDWRTIEFETSQVTSPDVALSPDGNWLVFTILGHLFRLPVEGGSAEQLTFGPYYDAEPAISPDGRRIAFQSDRDGSDGNIFVLDLASGAITQLTRGEWARTPVWSPDGEAIIYLVRPQRRVDGSPAEIRRVALAGGESETLVPSGVIRTAFFMPDGRLAWTVMEPDTGLVQTTTRIEVRSPEGRVSTLRTVAGYVYQIVPSPNGDGLYGSQYLLIDGTAEQPKNLVFAPTPEGRVRYVVPLSGWYRSPRFAVTADAESLYLGDGGRLWKISLPEGEYELVPFRARVTLEVLPPLPPPRPILAAEGPFEPRGVECPTLSPDGRTLVFVAAGHLWQQSLDGGEARRLFEARGFASYPRFSPDGSRLAFVELGQGELQVLNIETGQVRTLVASGAQNPSWSPDGERLVYRTMGGDHELIVVNVADGRQETVARTRWFPYPSFSADGQFLYYATGIDGVGTFVRLSLGEGRVTEPVTRLDRDLDLGFVSPDGTWLAFARNREIWIAPFGDELVTEDEVRRLTRDGGKTFTFAPDGSALIYAAGPRVWRHPLDGGERVEIPIRLELPRPTNQPLLVRGVRVLDFASGGFGAETTLLIDQGRIRWIGPEGDREVPQGTIVLDAGGRFAIPGLFDMHYDWCTYNPAFLAYGITSVRCPDDWGTTMADRGDSSGDPVPRPFFSGTLFEGANSVGGNDYLQIHDEDEARNHVRLWKARGAQFIKPYSTLPWPLHRAVADEARRHGLPVVGQGLSVEEVTKSVTLGYASLEHYRPEDRWYDDVLQMFASAGTRWDPTLTGMDAVHYLLSDNAERLLDAKLRAFVGVERFRELQGVVVHRHGRGLSARILAGIRAAHQRGVRLLAGTGTFPGPPLHWELELFVEAGLPPLEVLRIATQEGATAVGADDHLGTLEPGKLADIVLLDANPLENIRNTQSIWRVIKGGWLFDPEELEPDRTGT